jgi:hypothetical protein
VEAKLKGQPAIENDRDSMILPLLLALKQSVAQTRPTARPRGKNPAPRKRGKRTA